MSTSILIMVDHRALHKKGQMKPLDRLTTNDLHPNVKYNQWWVANVFGVLSVVEGKRMVRIVKSQVKEIKQDHTYELSFITDLVNSGQTLSGEMLDFHFNF